MRGKVVVVGSVSVSVFGDSDGEQCELVSGRQVNGAL